MTIQTIQPKPRILYFSDDSAHCTRSDCSRATECLRREAFVQKMEVDAKNGRERTIVLISPSIEDCPLFWEI